MAPLIASAPPGVQPGRRLHAERAVSACAAAAGRGVWRPGAVRASRTPALLRPGPAALVGKSAVVLAEVTADSGQVRIGGEVWSSRPYDGSLVIPVGST